MIIHNPNNLPTTDYRLAKPLQGELKDLTAKNHDKLKAVLEKRGFYVPLFLWQSGDDFYLLDGHQRQRVMVKNDMHDNGSYLVPYVLIGSFPMDYDFLDIRPEYLIGMSVPPVMMAQVAHSVFEQIIKAG